MGFLNEILMKEPQGGGETSFSGGVKFQEGLASFESVQQTCTSREIHSIWGGEHKKEKSCRRFLRAFSDFSSRRRARGERVGVRRLVLISAKIGSRQWE